MLVKILVSTLERVEQQQVLQQQQQQQQQQPDSSTTLVSAPQPAGEIANHSPGVPTVNQHSKTGGTGSTLPTMAGRAAAPVVEGTEEDLQQSVERESQYRVALRAHLWATLVDLVI